MPRFAAIEGVRAWLAWAVVVSHIAQVLGLGLHGGHEVWLGYAGEAGVMTFIAISGFVIAGLVVDKNEPWPRYITRRAFRIFPAYWVAYAAAFLALPLAISALAHVPALLADPAYNFDEILHGWQTAVADRPIEQIGLHVALLQGVVPDSLWPYSSTAVLGPAWSLTLEWQFYLIAPAFVWLVARDSSRMAITLVVAALAVAFHMGLFGHYDLPSFLPGAGYIFLIGIASRLNFERLKSAPVGPEIVPVALAIGILFPGVMFLAVWLCVLAYLARREAWAASPSGRRFASVMDALFASPVAQWFGARSYAVYLVHFPIIMALSLPILRDVQGGTGQLFLAFIGAVIPLTLLASELMHRLVERPFIALGARLARGAPRTPMPAA